MGIGGRANTALATLRPPPFPTPSRREVTVWSVGAAWLVKQLEGVGVESRGEAWLVPPWHTLHANADCAKFVFSLYSFLFCHL